ncbi:MULTISPECIES: DUF6075 family protein [Enterococcus]|uniref:DUF6075 family protein n=1 Tax=Enterococcus TaxID=1350 RepID=UPI001E41E9D8|nr:MULTISPECIES: DUF6075 family protein [Enterococcus]UXK05775.1 DUF6075 family protein [Enterococcus raffinosus]
MKDPYWRSLMYIVSGNETLFANRHSLINYKEREINSEVWFTGSFSGGEQRLLQLAFNLFTNLPYYLTEGDQKEYISPLEIFAGLDDYHYRLAKNALDVRLRV